MVFVKEWRWRRLLIRQHDLSDCGPACVASICSYHKKYVPVAKIRQLAKTDPNGTTLLGIVDAASVLGLDAKGIRADSPENVAMPAIVHVIVDERISHYMVLLNITKKKVTVMDPAEGRLKTMSRGEFNKIWTGIAVFLMPGEKFLQSKTRSTLKKISLLVVPFRRSLAWAMICSGIVSILGMTTSVYVKEVVDVILVRKNVGLLNIATAIAIVMLIMQCIVTLIKGRIVMLTGRTINTRLIMSYYRHVLHLPQSFFGNMRVGEMLNRINDAAKITAFIHEVAVNLIVDGLVVVFSIGAMFYFNWKIAVLVSCVIPGCTVMYIISNRINKRWQRKIAVSAANLDSSLVESFGALSTIRNLALESYFSKKVFNKLELLLKNGYEAAVKQLNVQGAADLLSRLIAVVLLWIGSYYVMTSAMTTGELMLFYTLLMWLTVPLLSLLTANRMYNEAAISADRLFEILELEPDENGCKKVDVNNVTIEFKDVWFAYGYNDHILKGINLTVETGTIVGITGKSGSGKSTLASLLLRSYKPSSGYITINGVNILEIDGTCIHEMMSIVTQKTELFSVTIRENITIGREYNEERLNDVCERLGITEFASFHTSALDMLITEQGNNLSGGQKQRIAIARAIYRNTPLLILDEATAAIDTLSEEKIMQTIEWYKNSGNTVIIIAHSESTLKICDNIVILDDGVIK
jgi:ATP-binding cassette subfamily B protein